MKYAALRAPGQRDNEIFDLSSPANRDNCFGPYARLREYFLGLGIQLDTSDRAVFPLSFELHQDVQPTSSAKKNYLLLFETDLVRPANGTVSHWNNYRKIFTWNDDLVDGKRFIKVSLPNPIRSCAIDGLKDRDRFCCVISGNKTLSVVDDRDLYVERIKSIRWFEKNAPDDFDLYGSDWDLPPWGRGRLGKISRKAFRIASPLVAIHPFPSYRGKIASKRDALIRTRYAICYENVRDLPGYITEKIFDCFFSGCVPVYWGAANVTEYIPADCFIDRRQFRNTGEVYHYLKGIGESEFQGYQQRIATFLASDAAFAFGSEYFAETIVKTIVDDLAR